MVATAPLHFFSTGFALFGTVYFGVFVKGTFRLQMMSDATTYYGCQGNNYKVFLQRKKEGCVTMKQIIEFNML